MAGRLVADTARGLDNEADKNVQEEAQTALNILNTMIEIEKKGVQEVKAQSQGLLERFDVTMGELKILASGGKSRPDPMVKSKTGTAEALKAQDDNLKKLMEVSVVDLAMLVDSSEMAAEEERPLPENPGPDGPCTTYVAPNPQSPYANRPVDPETRKKLEASGLKFVEEQDQHYGSDHYKTRAVQPASEVPTDQDERAKWLAKLEQGGKILGGDTSSPEALQARLDWAKKDSERHSKVDESRKAAGPYDMDEMRRLSGLNKPKSNDQDEDGK